MDTKDQITISGLVVTFLFSCLNYHRTSQTSKRTTANNRAARFEAVHGATLNEAVKELSEIAREISINIISLQSTEDAKSFFREKIKSRLTKAEHMVVNEVFQISGSSVAKDPSAWQRVAASSEWEDVQERAISILAAAHLDEVKAHLEFLKKSLVKVAASLTEVRAAENDV